VPKPLLIVFTGTTVPIVRERHGDFDAHFRAGVGDAWAGPWATIDVRDEATPLPPLEDLSGLIVTGSASSVTERAPWMLRVEGWLREAVERETPLLGVCFGHQLLASALGGEVRRNPAGRRLGSLQVRRVAEDPLLERVPEAFTANVSHQDHVGRAPDGIRLLVTAGHDPIHAFGVGRFARTTQFHPEFDGAIVRGYLEARRDQLRAEGMDPDALHEAAVDAPHARSLLPNFVRHFVMKR
jgi:GMP synthase (glutamine-hydrolysing)